MVEMINKLGWVLCFSLVALSVSAQHSDKLLPTDWDPKDEADQVLKSLVKVTPQYVKGAHDAEMVIIEGKAYIVAEVNDLQPGEAANWPFVYITMSILDLKTQTVEKTFSVAKSEQIFQNDTLPLGACFVPRIIQKDAKTLRCYFANENPGKRQSQIWYIDYNIIEESFDDKIYQPKLKTESGVYDMQPQYFYEDAVKNGFRKKTSDAGFYIFDSFKQFEGQRYVTLNNFLSKQNALAILNNTLDTFHIAGHYNEPQEFQLSESAVNRLPDGIWIAICRQDEGSKNYMFTTSRDGKNWTEATYKDFVPNGTNSKPTFNHFNGLYYLGWQDNMEVNGVHRSVFNIDISKDGEIWERKFRFESEESFQYPSFHQYNESIWLVVTQGSSSSSRKERIMFGKLE